ncbi:MAG: DUF1648 domain-containing protein [Candidatus Hydrogenedentes bacterium]|nr:DUF1648 domain-containing protein [Candidatus Hydrogenedentota bacterium]
MSRLFRGLLYAGPFLILAAGAVYLGLRWEEIPEKFPIHWGAHGVVNGWGTRTFFGVFGLLLLGTVVALGIVGGAVLVRVVGRRSLPEGWAEQDTRYRRMNEGLMLALGWLVAFIMTAAAVWLPFRESVALPIGFILVIAIGVLTIITVMVVYAFRASRARSRFVAAGGMIGDGAPDECWKWGVFYNNPDDMRLWVEKRSGMGWTLNMAHKASWWVLAGLMAFVAVDVLVALLITWAASR